MNDELVYQRPLIATNYPKDFYLTSLFNKLPNLWPIFNQAAAQSEAHFFAGRWSTKKQANDPSSSTCPVPISPNARLPPCVTPCQPFQHACMLFFFSRHELANSLWCTQAGSLSKPCTHASPTVFPRSNMLLPDRTVPSPVPHVVGENPFASSPCSRVWTHSSQHGWPASSPP